jgi:hypothetical protein
MRPITVPILCQVVVVFCVLACQEERAKTIDDLIESAPRACEQWCEKKTACGWEFNNPLPEDIDDDFIDDYELITVDRCVVDCLFYLDRGAAAYERVIDQCHDYNSDDECIDPVYEHLPLDPVSGSQLKDFLTCILDFYACEEEDSEEASWAIASAVDEPSCEQKSSCYAALGLEGTVAYEWSQDGSYSWCNYVEPERDYSILGPDWL